MRRVIWVVTRAIIRFLEENSGFPVEPTLSNQIGKRYLGETVEKPKHDYYF